ncbi:outer membrane beta-barrel family protein [Nibrella saemangeumensis]|uniref:Outer membrane beta-barrel family protein n=1 Tax=Nibrella saemangeumensis TaxID=1084526 RepID=A0ABP8MYP6_9BACT
MKYIYSLLLFTCLFALHQTTLAQISGTLTGTLTDSSGTGVGFGTVAVVQTAKKAIVTGAVTEADGRFSIKTPAAGTYFLRITALGYATLETPTFAVTDPSFSKDFGTLTLRNNTKQLKEVTVRSSRATITQEADRMVVNIAGTALAAGSTAYDVLGKSPGVFIDQDGNIQLNGRSGVTVMLNGKLTFLSARDLRTMLEGMPAENIKNIEIITNPSAKYDAEGTSGILNINLKKNTQQGMNGSLYASYNNNFKQFGYTYGGNVNYKSGRWNSFLNLDAARRVGGREATFTRIFYGTDKTTYFDQVATGNFAAEGPPSVRMGTDYSINDRHSIGATAYYITNFSKSDFLTDTYIGNAPRTYSQYIDADNINTNRFTSFTSNLHYTGKLDTLGTTLSTDLDYARITNRGDGNFYNYFTDLASGQQTRDFLYTSTPNGYDILSAKIDFTRPLSPGHKLEAGAKASRVVSDNDFRFYFNNEGLALDPKRTNHFNYRESIYAGYLNWNGKLNKRFTMQAGLRAEQTLSVGNSYTTGQVTERKYLNFFPSVFLQQKVSDDYQISYSYSRRLTRPNYGNLNPFRYYRDPYTYTEGNPYLRPQYTQAFSINQTIRKVYNLSAYYQFHRDVMSEVPILDVANATTIYTTGNLNEGHNLGITAVAPVKITRWWDTQNTTILSYNKFTTVSNEGPLVNDQVFYMLQSNHTLQLPMNIRMEMNLLYRGPAASGLYHMAPMHRVDIAFKKSFMNKKLDLTVNANDLFKGFRYYWTTNINRNVNEFDQYFRWRSVGVTLRYNFSRGSKVDEKRRNNNLEEMNRT